MPTSIEISLSAGSPSPVSVALNYATAPVVNISLGEPVTETIEISFGNIGPRGLSAYQVALANGYSGTEDQWLDSLVGDSGPAGADGADGAQGIQGIPGNDGADGTNGSPGANGTNGTNGAAGAAGVGVPTGGSTGQVLTKINGTDYNTQWVTLIPITITKGTTAARLALSPGEGDIAYDTDLHAFYGWNNSSWIEF